MQSSYYTTADSRCVSLVLPGLLAAEALGQVSIETPFLCRCLSHATASHAVTDELESVVLNWFNGGESADENCAALFGYRLDTGCSEVADTVMRADPVYQQMDINNAVLADPSILDLTLTEAQALVSTLNQHFATDGVVFRVAKATRWYCTFTTPLDIKTSSPSRATGRDVAQESPRGSDASKWRGWLAEIEMLLHSHPINQQRQLHGKVTVNSLWLWGEGQPKSPAANDARDVVVFSQNFYTRSIAHHQGVEVRGLDSFATHNSVKEKSVLVVDDSLQRAATTADEQLRNDTLLQLEVKVFEPLWKNLGGGGWQSVRIWSGADRWLQIDRMARYKFWRRSRPLRSFIDSGEVILYDD